MTARTFEFGINFTCNHMSKCDMLRLMLHLGLKFEKLYFHFKSSTYIKCPHPMILCKMPAASSSAVGRSWSRRPQNNERTEQTKTRRKEVLDRWDGEDEEGRKGGRDLRILEFWAVKYVWQWRCLSSPQGAGNEHERCIHKTIWHTMKQELWFKLFSVMIVHKWT